MALSVDWNSVFVPAIGLAEIVVRGSLMYLGLFVILRFMARRQAGHFGPADLLVIVLIADAAQNGLGKEYSSVTEGLALVLTIVAWEYLLDWIAWRFPATQPYLKPPSLTLVRDDRLIPQNLRKEMITEDELKSQLREQSVDNYEKIRLATLEGDGRLSVLKRQRYSFFCSAGPDPGARAVHSPCPRIRQVRLFAPDGQRSASAASQRRSSMLLPE
jgi:uncharacterized membrane protein YcaP (DUF421 family)